MSEKDKVGLRKNFTNNDNYNDNDDDNDNNVALFSIMV